MTDKHAKTEPPLCLEMDFGEALARFTQAKPKEVHESEDRAKQKKKPGEDIARRSSAKDGG